MNAKQQYEELNNRRMTAITELAELENESVEVVLSWYERELGSLFMAKFAEKLAREIPFEINGADENIERLISNIQAAINRKGRAPVTAEELERKHSDLWR